MTDLDDLAVIIVAYNSAPYIPACCGTPCATSSRPPVNWASAHRDPEPIGLAILGSMMVLNFHCIGRSVRELVDGEGDVCVDTAQFAEILDVVSGRDEVRLTFDDGNRSDVTEALPELVRRGLHAEFFICPARFGTAGFLDEDDVASCARPDVGRIARHGSRAAGGGWLSEIDREIVQAKQLLEDALQTPVETAACPFGAYDRRTLSALRAAGFKRVYTSDGGRAGATDWLVARNTVRRVDSAESIERLLNGFREPCCCSIGPSDGSSDGDDRTQDRSALLRWSRSLSNFPVGTNHTIDVADVKAAVVETLAIQDRADALDAHHAPRFDSGARLNGRPSSSSSSSRRRFGIRVE